MLFPHRAAPRPTRCVSPYPVYSRLISGATCDVIGGEVTHDEEYIYEWTRRDSCAAQYDLYDQVIDGTWVPEGDHPADGGIPDRIYP